MKKSLKRFLVPEVLLVFLLLFLIGNVPVHAITEEELLNGLISGSASLKEYGNDIETLTVEYREDSQEQNLRLDKLELDLSKIESGSEDIKTLDLEFELQLMTLTSSFGEYKKRELFHC